MGAEIHPGVSGHWQLPSLAIIITACLGLYMRRENKRRDRVMGVEQPMKPGDIPMCDLKDGQKDIRFRYWT